MIHKFEQFINESTNFNIEKTNFNINVQKQFLHFLNNLEYNSEAIIDRIQQILQDLSDAIDDITIAYKHIIVGDPIIKVTDDLSDIDVTINTTVPYTYNDDLEVEGKTKDIEWDVQDMLDRFPCVFSGVKENKEDGTTSITCHSFVLEREHFNEYIDVVKFLGSDWTNKTMDIFNFFPMR